jgi:hypothetical protein
MNILLNIVLPPAIRILLYKSLLISESHFSTELNVPSWIPWSYLPANLDGWNKASAQRNTWFLSLI